MKRFTVVWHPLAEVELTETWNESPDKQAITDAANRIDQLLANDPERVGSQVSGRSRELTIPSLQVLFRVSHEDRIVQVFSVACI